MELIAELEKEKRGIYAGLVPPTIGSKAQTLTKASEPSDILDTTPYQMGRWKRAQWIRKYRLWCSAGSLRA
jgi:hypothetical protein